LIDVTGISEINSEPHGEAAPSFLINSEQEVNDFLGDIELNRVIPCEGSRDSIAQDFPPDTDRFKVDDDGRPLTTTKFLVTYTLSLFGKI
jgi:hypothetical protein